MIEFDFLEVEFFDVKFIGLGVILINIFVGLGLELNMGFIKLKLWFIIEIDFKFGIVFKLFKFVLFGSIFFCFFFLCLLFLRWFFFKVRISK